MAGTKGSRENKQAPASASTSAPTPVYCVGSPTFVPEEAIKNAETHEKTLGFLAENNFDKAIRTWFGIPDEDKYVYHAITSVRLDQVQQVVALGGANGLHTWYRDAAGMPLPPPSPTDTEAYISIFLPNSNPRAALNSFAANAKKDSPIRRAAASHLQHKRFINPTHPLAATLQSPPRSRKSSPPLPSNPYLDFWAWSCRALEWCGPTATSPDDEGGDVRIASMSHHVLPVLMHHFGCAVPSHEALVALRAVCAGRTVADVGSGGGYWTFMLRQYGVSVVPVDSMQSKWRTLWVADTVVGDGERWVSQHQNGGDDDIVLLMVYPIVGGGVAGGVEGGFTRDLVDAYEKRGGNTVVVVGTQNRNGYTGFRDVTMDEYMAAREQKGKEKGKGKGKGWTRVMQVPLPSFAGKDEALYVFQREK